MNLWTESRAFLGQFRSQYFTTGSVLPSSRALGRALTRYIRRSRPPRRILEVGPGTGAVTRVLVDCLRPGDRLDIVEINQAFVEVVERRFAEEPAFRKARDLCRVFHRPLQEMPGQAEYDFMVSGLPLNNFPLALVEDIFASYERLLKPGGVLSYFEYAGIRDLKRKFVGPEERQRLTDLDRFLKARIRSSQVAEDLVLCNIPPAVARHLELAGRRPT
jgi:phospholipid N-methyltransferase